MNKDKQIWACTCETGPSYCDWSGVEPDIDMRMHSCERCPRCGAVARLSINSNNLYDVYIAGARLMQEMAAQVIDCPLFCGCNHPKCPQIRKAAIIRNISLPER